MGRSTDDPMPPPLNNKFDALPPAEGLKANNLSQFDIIHYFGAFVQCFNVLEKKNA
jgi:hypothetical protein